MKRITAPLQEKALRSLKAGDEVLLSGTIFTARDQAHKRLTQSLARRSKLPVALAGQVVYYCGPTGTPEHTVIGSCGPTTSRRMDAFTPALLAAGLKGMIGKGNRSPQTIAAIKKHKAVYFLAYAGCGALLAQFIRSALPVAYPDLGPEAIVRLQVRDLPLIVGIDCRGKSVYPVI
ncbi:MAG TPA: FumA C-terminus/TtdB family hydratase beta subunit [Candidatus Omnitrophota bacterium]|nr:FumA C-terminus/TtdB family hydratase beta subunit [Candidatus Omnitrophota bacterium]